MQIEYTNIEQCNIDWKELEALLKPLHKSGTLNYTKPYNHPTESKMAIPIDLIGDYKNPIEKWIKEKGLALSKRTSDWTIKADLI